MSAETALTIDPALCKRAETIMKSLKDAGLSIVTAESCTAGMVAAVPGFASGLVVAEEEAPSAGVRPAAA